MLRRLALSIAVVSCLLAANPPKKTPAPPAKPKKPGAAAWLASKLGINPTAFANLTAVRGDAGVTAGSRVVELDLTTNKETTLWECGRCWSPAITASGIAVLREDAGTTAIWLLPIDGGAPRAVMSVPAAGVILGTTDSPNAIAVAVHDPSCADTEYAALIADLAAGTGAIDMDAPCLAPPFPARDRLANNRILATTAERDATGKRIPRRLIVKEPADAAAPSAKRLAPFSDTIDRFDPVWRSETRVVYVASGGEPAASPATPASEPRTMTSFFLRAWIPELGAPQYPLSEFETGLMRVASLAREGKFKSAEAELAQVKPLATSTSEQFLYAAFRLRTHTRRYFLIDADEMSPAEQFPFTKFTEMHEFAETYVSLKPRFENFADASELYGVALGIDIDLETTLGQKRGLAEMRASGRFPNLPRGEELGAEARRLAREGYVRAAGKGVISRRDADVLNLFIDGRMMSADGNRDGAVKLLSDAVAIAPPDGAAQLLLHLGDAYVAPLGSPLLLGINPGTGTYTRNLLEYSVAPPSLVRPDARAIAAAAGYYDRAADAAKGNAATMARIASRRAYLRFLGGDRTGAAADLERIAAGDGVTAWAASVSAGLLQNRRAAIRRGTAAAAAEQFDGAIASFAETARTFALATAFLSGNVTQGLEILEHAGDAVIETGRRRTAVGLLEETATLANRVGRQDSAIVAVRQAVALMEHHVAALDRVEASDDYPELLFKTERVAFLNLQQSRSTYGNAKRADEQTGGWTREAAALQKQKNAVVPELAAAVRGEVDVETLVFLKSEMDAARAIPYCAGRLEKLRDVRRRSVESGMAEWLLIFDIANRDCVPEWLEEDRKRIEAEDIVEPLRAALAEKKPADTIDPLIQLILRSLEVLEHSEGWEALARYTAKFAALIPAAPVLQPYAVPIRRYLALAALERGKPEETRQLVEEVVAVPLWPTRSAIERMALLSIGVEAEAALCERGSCDAARALHLLELLHDAQREAQFMRSGVAAARKETAERAALEASLARAETMTDADLARLRALRDQQTTEVAPLASPPSRAEVDAVLRALPGGVTALVFHPARRHVIAWKAGKNELRLVRIANADETIERLASQLQTELANTLDEGWPDMASALYAALIAPLGDIPPANRLVVVAGGALGTIPFDILRQAAGKLLVLDHPVTVTDRIAGAATASAAKKALAVGLNSGPLTEAEEEARAVAQLVGGAALTGAQATAANVREGLRDARFVHFATHATLLPENPFETYLTLAAGERLEAWRLFRDAPAARLITLSACEAAARPRALGGRAATVSESTSLVAFAFAGNAKYVLASLWRANDRFAVDLMKAFYDQLARKPGDESGALHRAKLAVSKNGQVHPYYWANFVLSARSLEAAH